MPGVLPSVSIVPFRRGLLFGSLLALLLSLSLAAALFADTPGTLRKKDIGGCYCRCSQNGSMNSCIKICDLPRYASRWWATTCAKPRIQTPAARPGAGPRFPHPGRAERAAN